MASIVKRILITLLIALLLVGLLLLFEYLTYKVFEYIFAYTIVGIAAVVIVNYFIVRHFILLAIFPLKNKHFLRKVILLELGEQRANALLFRLEKLTKLLQYWMLVNDNTPSVRSVRSSMASKQSVDLSEPVYAENPVEKAQQTSELIFSIIENLNYYLTVREIQDETSNSRTVYEENLFSAYKELKEKLLMTDIYKEFENSAEGYRSIAKLSGEKIRLQIASVNVAIERLSLILQEYLLKEGSFFDKCSNYAKNDCMCTIDQLQAELRLNFNCEFFNVKTSDNKAEIDAILFKSRRKLQYKDGKFSQVESYSNLISIDSKSLNLMIICGQNGSIMEMHSENCKSIDMYLKRKIWVLTWNYRGYGKSTGTVNFTNMQEDAKTLANYVKGLYNFDKVGVHGISLGGIPACYLAKENIVDFCLADRTFSNFKSVTGEFVGGWLIKFLYKVFVYSDVNNTHNFLESKCFKVVGVDPKDSVIPYSSSLHSGISKKLIYELPQQIRGNKIQPCESVLELVLRKQSEYSELILSLTSLLADLNIDTPPIEKHSTNSTNSIEDGELKAIFNKHSKDDEGLEITSPIAKIIPKIRRALKNFDAANVTLLDICRESNQTQKESFLKSFFNNLLVWGTIREGSFTSSYIRKRKNVEGKIDRLISDCEDIMKELSLCSSNGSHCTSLVLQLEVLTKLVKKLKVFAFSKRAKKIELKKLGGSTADNTQYTTTYSETELKSNLIKNDEFLDYIDQRNDGNVLPLTCGHNGIYSTNEYENYLSLLRQAKFIN